MNQDLLRRVRDLRSHNPFRPLSITTAVQIARSEKDEPEAGYEFLSDLDEGEADVFGDVGPLHVRVRVLPDDDMELGEDDVSGTFTDNPSDTTVLNTRRNWGTDYKYYQPSTIRLSQTRADYTALGMSKSVADEALRHDIDQDMADDATRAYYRVTVTVSIDGRELGSASLWGIDTIDGYNGRGYFIDTARELIAEAMDQAATEGPQAVEKARAAVEKAREHVTQVASAAAYLAAH